jgi:cyclophilin family peptidyl-prolyl cis-trans isomerase
MEDTTVDAVIARGNVACFFDVSIGGTPVGRLAVEVYKTQVPRAAENFRALCAGEVRRGGVPVGYKGARFHRVIKDFMVQGGDFVRGDGTGRTSIYGDKFDDEPAGLALRHAGAGVLSMANSGAHTNGCQWFITTGAAPHLDGKHVVLGRVLDAASMLVVRKIEAVPVAAGNKPKLDVIVAECGEL